MPENFWLEKSLTYDRFTDSPTGFKQHTQQGWQLNDGLLEGTAGILLALTTCLSEESEASAWTECLLI